MSYSSSHLSFGLLSHTNTHTPHLPPLVHWNYSVYSSWWKPFGDWLVRWHPTCAQLTRSEPQRARNIHTRAPRLFFCVSPSPPVLHPQIPAPSALPTSKILLTSVRWLCFAWWAPTIPHLHSASRQEPGTCVGLRVRFCSEITVLASGLWNVWKLSFSFILFSFPVVLVWGRVKFSTNNTMRANPEGLPSSLRSKDMMLNILFFGCSPCGVAHPSQHVLWQRMLWKERITS